MWRKILCLFLFLCVAPKSNSLVMIQPADKLEYANGLIQDLQKTTGLNLQLKDNFLRLEQSPLVGFAKILDFVNGSGSPTARYLLLGALNTDTVYRVKSTRDVVLGRAGGSIDLNFADLNHHVTFRDVPREAFGPGLIFLHELAHRHRGLVDPSFDQAKSNPDVKGETVEFINRMQRELGLPERLHYFPKKLPGRDDVLCIYFGQTQRVEIDAKLF